MRKLLAFTLLSACAAMPAQVQDLRLSDRALTIAMSDGTACHADWRAGPGEACGYHYEVQVDQTANPLRKIADGLVLALGSQNMLAPMAKVTLTDAQGRTLTFVSPKPVELN